MYEGENYWINLISIVNGNGDLYIGECESFIF